MNFFSFPPPLLVGAYKGLEEACEWYFENLK